MRKELQLLERWLITLASHAGIAPAAFDEIHALCQGLDADIRIAENTAEEARLTCQVQHERICALEAAAADAAAQTEYAADIRDRMSRAGHGERAE